jgi:hypothetical protein
MPDQVSDDVSAPSLVAKKTPAESRAQRALKQTGGIRKAQLRFKITTPRLSSNKVDAPDIRQVALTQKRPRRRPGPRLI